MFLKLKFHAMERLLERTRLSQVDIQDIYEKRKYIRIGNDLKKKNVVHWLTYNNKDNSFSVMVVDERKLEVITILYGDDFRTWIIDPAIKECCRIGDFEMLTLKHTSKAKEIIRNGSYCLKDFGFFLIKDSSFMCIGREYTLGSRVKKIDFFNYLQLKFNIYDDDLYYQIMNELNNALAKFREKNKNSKKLETQKIIERDKQHSTAFFKPVFNKKDLTYTIFDKTISVFENGMDNETITNDDFRSIVRVKHGYISNSNIDKIYNELLNKMKNARINYIKPYFNFYFVPFILNLSIPIANINECIWKKYCNDNNIYFKVSFFEGFMFILNQKIKTISKPKNIKRTLLPHITSDAIEHGFDGYIASYNALISYKNREKQEYPLEIYLIKNNHINIDFKQLQKDFLSSNNEVFTSDIINLLTENDLLNKVINKKSLIKLLKEKNIIPSISLDEMIQNIENEIKLKKLTHNFLIVLIFKSNIKNLDISFYDENLIIDDIYDENLIFEEEATAKLISKYTEILINKAKKNNQLNDIDTIKIYKKSYVMDCEFISNKTLYKKV
jgi:effector-binding domain-containing protein